MLFTLLLKYKNVKNRWRTSDFLNWKVPMKKRCGNENVFNFIFEIRWENKYRMSNRKKFLSIQSIMFNLTLEIN